MKNIEPKIAGIAKLMIHRILEAIIIPKIFFENNPMRKIASDPLKPNSTSVDVGMRVINK